MSTLADRDTVAEIEAELEQEIRSGQYAVGQKLVAGRELARRFGVPHCRVHRAIKNLEQKGLLYAAQGRGTFVADPATPQAVDVMPGGHAEMKQIRIAVSPDAGVDPWILQTLGKALEAVRYHLPFLDITLQPLSGERSAETADIELFSCHGLAREKDNVAALDDLDVAWDELTDGARDTGSFDGVLKGLPILWTDATVYAARAGLAECDHDALRNSTRPSDLFRVGQAIEESSNGALTGTRYRGAIYHSALYGVVFSHRDGQFHFDEDRMREFLEDMKPWIGKEQLLQLRESVTYAKPYAIMPDFTTGLHQFDDPTRYTTLPLPKRPGGFTCHSILLAGVRKEADPEDARMVLAALVKEDIQRILVGTRGEWLAIHHQVLREQERATPFATGAVSYRLDPRGVHVQKDHACFAPYAAHLNTEAGKFFMDIQPLDRTLDRLRSADISMV